MALARGARYVACRLVSFPVCPTVSPPSSGDGLWLRTAGQAGTGRGSRAAKPLLEGGRALASERVMVVKPAPLKEESPGFNQGSVKLQYSPATFNCTGADRSGSLQRCDRWPG